MARQLILSLLATGASIAEARQRLDGAEHAGRPLTLSIGGRATAYTDHVIDGFVDGPPTSPVVAVLSARDPDHADTWRRMTISRVGPWHYEVGVFPTPFGTAESPLSPGIPPVRTRGRHRA